MYSRILNPKSFLDEMSIFILGPRQTGKSTLLRAMFKSSATYLDLLDPGLFRDLQKNPSTLKSIAQASEKKIIIIDEIQKIPELLDVVHSIIEQAKDIRFVLSGSSARKLKSDGKNLLGGRAYPLYIHPICSKEFLKDSSSAPDIHSLIQLGGLPSVLTSARPFDRLRAYVGIYLQEEIKAEGYARNLGDFSRFLDVAAITNGEQLDYTGVARDAQLSPRTVASYYQILQDTLVGYLLPSFQKTKTRKAIVTPKFYFFDVGIANYISGREKLSLGTPEYGKALEHFIFTELLAYGSYSGKRFSLSYWRSTSQIEIDFIIETKGKTIIAIEVKGASHVDSRDEKGFRAFEDDFKIEKKIIVCNEKIARKNERDVQVLPILKFCEKLWKHEII